MVNFKNWYQYSYSICQWVSRRLHAGGVVGGPRSDDIRPTSIPNLDELAFIPLISAFSTSTEIGQLYRGTGWHIFNQDITDRYNVCCAISCVTIYRASIQKHLLRRLHAGCHVAQITLYCWPSIILYHSHTPLSKMPVKLRKVGTVRLISKLT